MTQSPAAPPRTLRPFGRVHIVGIGGIGMSGIAEVMHVMGYEVQGSDLGENANTRRLSDMGVPVMIGHREENIAGAGVVTVSSAVTQDNVEMVAARARHIPVVRRAEMLAELMRLKPCLTVAGTHGKTTTTSLAAAVLDAAGLDPTVINGGIINAYGTNARLGSGDWRVVEADESDGTFVRLPATMGIVTNIDHEHLEHYGSFENLRDAFVRYMQNIPADGAGIVCLDHPEVQALVGQVQDRRIITYGLNEQADIRATNITTRGFAQEFDVICRDRPTDTQTVISNLHLPMAGTYNLQNALAAIAAGLEVRAEPEQIRAALSGFSGVNRRFSHVGKVR
ncbi:MAG: UDP-N-acetylmuramate--L-alanine ligase, partial [Pseudomonadota bacterium]|nr:UDP-N-acetylmuramate--L-alanine ligase [Pseudomonadota bacterium]